MSDMELSLFHEGSSAYLYKSLGCHRIASRGEALYRFAVWAPNAKGVSVVGGFNGWDPLKNPMRPNSVGVWEALVPGLSDGDLYKYCVTSQNGGRAYKADPFAFFSQRPPGTASRVWDISGFEWNDAEYLSERKPTLRAPMCVYEMHAGSFNGGSYRGIADKLAPYVRELGFTHIQLLPLSEHTQDASWGYQVTGFYSATSRFGEPRGLMYLIDTCHASGIGVILDWVSACFACDEHGLRLFDGTPLFEPGQSEPNRFGTAPFDLEKPEVRSFLLSNAMFWLKEFHLDGLHLSNLSAMLFPAHGERFGDSCAEIPAESPGRARFLRELSETLRREFPGAALTAQEYTGYPGVTKSPSQNGLGIHYKWNLGYAADLLTYMSADPPHRKWHHDKLTSAMTYAFAENHILPFSHTDVAFGKRSLLDKMPGDYNDKFDQLRLLLAFTYAHPGKKLLFMGCEIGQFAEWRYGQELDWKLLDHETHSKLKHYVSALNSFYRSAPAFYTDSGGFAGFEWLSADDDLHSVIAFARKAESTQGDDEIIACVYNFTPLPHDAYRLGVSDEGVYELVFNSAIEEYGGGVLACPQTYVSQRVPCNDIRHSIVLKLPPYCALYLRHVTLTEDEALAE